MKNCLFLLGSIVLFGLNACQKVRMPEAPDRISRFRQLENNFQNVPQEYHPVVSWIWNDMRSNKTIDDQLNIFASDGFGGVFVFPEKQLFDEYSADEWQDLLAYAGKRARKLGLFFWIFDEDLIFSGSEEQVKSNPIPELWKESISMRAAQHKQLKPLSNQENAEMHLFHKFPLNAEFSGQDISDKIRIIRKFNSVANQLGIQRKISNNYECTLAGPVFEEIKHSVDMEFIFGLNFLNGYLYYSSISGNTKYYPQFFSFKSSDWNELVVLNEYFSRLSFALSSGEQINKILVLEPLPMESAGLSDKLTGNVKTQAIKAFSKLLLLLEKEYIEYDLGSEDILTSHGSTEKDLFIVGERTYNYVVIPEMMRNFSSMTFELIQEYLHGGGIIISLCNPPAFIDGMASDLPEELSKEYSDQWLTMAGCDDPRLVNSIHNTNIIVVEESGANVFHMRRQLEDGQLIFLVNPDKRNNATIRLMMQGRDLLELDAMNGKVTKYPCVVSDDLISFDVGLPPVGSKLLFVSEAEVEATAPRQLKWRNENETLDLSELKTQTHGQNVLNLDFCKLLIGKDTIPEDYFFSQQTRIFKAYDIQADSIFSSSLTKPKIARREVLVSNPGFTVSYSFMVDSRFRSKELYLVVEQADRYSVYLNDKTLTQQKGKWWLEEGFGMFRISGNIKPEENIIQLIADPASMIGELNPVYLVGDFDVLPLDKGWLLSRASKRSPGTWKEIGLPFFPECLEYSSSFYIEQRGAVKVSLPDWRGTVAKVLINGNEAGNIISKPYELRLDDFVHKGQNNISILVFGSFRNAFGPFHDPGHVPNIQPPGTEYILQDFGLKEPFKVYIMK